MLGLTAGEARAAYTAEVEAGVVSLTGDGASDRLALVTAGTALVVDVGIDRTVDFFFDSGTFTAVEIQAGRGNDEVTVTGNLAPLATLSVDGGPGDDLLLGGNGPDVLLGGAGNDVVDGQQGSDTAVLGGGSDRFVWDPGDGSDTVEGQTGSDVVQFNGSNGPERIAISANGPRVTLTRDLGSIVMDIDDVEAFGLNTFGAIDTVTVDHLAGTDVRTVDVDLNLFGGGGDVQPDTVVVRGTEGADSVTVGSSAGLPLVSGLAAQVRVTGGEAEYDNITVETLGGTDTVTGGVTLPGPVPVNVDGGADADTVRYIGTAGADTIYVVANGLEATAYASPTGQARLDVLAVESLVLSGLGGADTMASTGNVAPLTALTMDGGDGDDVLGGGNGADLLVGGAGNDSVDGNQGADRALLGSGDDRFQWDPGDGNDVVEGQSGGDLLDFFGSSIGEIVEATANGGRVQLTRNIANITMGLAGVESLALHVLGGADTIVVSDLAGTSARTVYADLGTLAGTGDGQPDTVVVNGRSRGDVVQVTRSGPEVLVPGLPAQTTVSGSEAGTDILRVQTLGGNDVVTVAPDVADLIVPVVDLGADE